MVRTLLSFTVLIAMQMESYSSQYFPEINTSVSNYIILKTPHFLTFLSPNKS